MTSTSILIIVYLCLNLYGFFLMGFDKKKAVTRGWRVSEKHIWFTAFTGGALGAMLGMKQFRHKTKHHKFRIFLPLLVVLTLCVYLFFIVELA